MKTCAFSCFNHHTSHLNQNSTSLPLYIRSLVTGRRKELRPKKVRLFVLLFSTSRSPCTWSLISPVPLPAVKSPPWHMKFGMILWNLEPLYPKPGSPVHNCRKFSFFNKAKHVIGKRENRGKKSSCMFVKLVEVIVIMSAFYRCKCGKQSPASTNRRQYLTVKTCAAQIDAKSYVCRGKDIVEIRP